MLEDFQEQTYANAAPGNLQEIAEGLVAWHQRRMKNISSVLEAPADTEVHLGETVLTGEKLQGFRIGLIIAQEWFEKFPLSVNRAESAGDDIDEED